MAELELEEGVDDQLIDEAILGGRKEKIGGKLEGGGEGLYRMMKRESVHWARR